MHPLISVQDLRVSFRMGPRSVEAVRGVSFDIQPNSTLALVGESGSGKTVSAMSIVRLLPDNALIGAASKILYNGQDLLRAAPESLRGLRGKDISVVFQDPMGSLNPVFTVGEQIAEVLAIHLGLRARRARFVAGAFGQLPVAAGCLCAERGRQSAFTCLCGAARWFTDRARRINWGCR